MSTFKNSTMCYHFHFFGMNYLTKYIDHRTIESILGFIISFAVLFALYTGLYKGLKTALLPKELYKSGRSSQFFKKTDYFVVYLRNHQHAQAPSPKEYTMPTAIALEQF